MPLTAESAEMLAKGTLMEVDYAGTDRFQLARAMRSGAFPPIPFDNPPRTEDISIPGPYRPIPARVYTPDLPGPLPVAVSFHGGGWVIGTLEIDDYRCQNLAKDAGCVVVSIDYCLAPEHVFPAPVEECYAATAWVAANAGRLGADAARLAVTGNSAGANLAAAVALMARDRGGPAIGFQLLNYPVTDADLGRPSYRENGVGYGLTTAAMQWFIEQYLPDPAQRTDPYALPIHAANLSGLPPALVITCEYDVLRDEGEAYGEAMRAAGNEVTIDRYAGVPHGFLSMMPLCPESGRAMKQGAAAMRAAWHRTR
jgi:acetyl esterase